MKNACSLIVALILTVISSANNLKSLLDIGKVSKDSGWEVLIQQYSYPRGTNSETMFKNLDACRYVFNADTSFYGVQVPVEYYVNKKDVRYGFWLGFKIYDAYRLTEQALNKFLNKYMGGNHAYDFITKKIEEVDKQFGSPVKTEKLDKVIKRNRYFDQENKILLIVDYYSETGAVKETQVLFTNNQKELLPEERIYPYEENSKYIILKGKKFNYKFAAMNRKFNYDKVGNAGERYSFEEYGRLYQSIYAYDTGDYPYALDGGIYKDAKMYKDSVMNLKETRYEIKDGYKTEVRYVLKRENGRTAYCYKILGVLKNRPGYEYNARVWAEATLYFYEDKANREAIAADFFDSFEIKY